MKKSCYQLALLSISLVLGLSTFGTAFQQSPLLVWQNLNTKSGLISDQIQAMCVFNHNTFIGTDKGLVIYHTSTKQIDLIDAKDGLPHNSILALYPDDQQVWIGTKQGLAIWKNQKLVASIPRPLRKLPIRAITKKGPQIYLGTDKGLWLYDLEKKTTRRLKHLKGKNIRVLKSVDQGLLISTDKSQSSLFKPDTWHMEDIKVEFNSQNNQITDIGGLGDYIWFATDGNGLIGYNILSYQWFSFHDSTQVDAFANAILEDGRQLWYGSFSGLYSYDVLSDHWALHPHPTLQTHGVSALAINGHTLWVGTPSGGVLYADKKTPHFDFDLPSRYYSNEKAIIRGYLAGSTSLTAQLSYRSLGSPQTWLSDHIKLQITDYQFTAEIDFSALSENIYEFRLNVEDKQQGQNEERFTLIKEMHGVKLVPKPTTLKKGRTRLTGQYENKNIKKIVINPGNTLATLNPKQRTFTGEVVLNLENKQIQLSMFENKGKANHVYYPIKVKPAPKLKVIPLATTFIPGLSEVPFHLSYDKNIASVGKWEFRIATHNGTRIKTLAGEDKLPSQLTWDGTNNQGNHVPEGQVFYYSFHFKDTDDMEVMTAQGLLRSAVTFHPTGKRVREKIPVTFIFEKGKTTLLPQSDASHYEIILQHVKNNDDWLLSIEGHTDNQPILSDQFDSNQRLSEARAKNIANQLIQKYKFSSKRIMVIGYGASLPLEPNDTEEGRRANRRVEVFLLK